ncbi:predicted protein [Chaetomium globosum CBS 148.51]|uniref:Uncharacterized protein n=1 Tax=Chaetomium globosum (strain ATCC 6205 / CBS 148.51 / DSM 1962 / NBRC 6347 / NRRL 1970) TaxID=306901 RepID=Q2HFD8_CHAGB|nr:uncharacterized protein CHGG_01066 [Chaetomium globosum CBS 148.51]EAQ92831.1 predicted protein [Chaetomium globosum CBS 148.51]
MVPNSPTDVIFRHHQGAPPPTTCCGTVGIIAGPRAV